MRVATSLAIVVGLTGLLSACAGELFHDPEIVGATTESVSVYAGINRSPDALAAVHCAKHGKQAYLTRREVMRAGASRVSYFDCR